MTWDEYSDECEQCWRNYNSNPRVDACYMHKGQKNIRRPLDDKLKDSTFVWHEDEPPYDFDADPFVRGRLLFQRWLWADRPDDEH